MFCGKQKSLSKLRRDIAILQGFYQQQPSYRLASDLGLDAKTITRVYQRLRMVLFHKAEFEGAKLSGEIEMDESYFGGTRKWQRGRGAQGKSIFLACWSEMARSIRRWWRVFRLKRS
jgi:transposase